MSDCEPNKWLKLKTKQLIKRCGGLEKASEVCGETCRPYSVPHLSRCQNPNAPDFLPIDIVQALEDYCGDRLLTRAMAEDRPTDTMATDLRDEVSEATERMAAIQRKVREALADGHICAREAAEIAAEIEGAFSDLHEARAALAHATAPRATGAA